MAIANASRRAAVAALLLAGCAHAPPPPSRPAARAAPQRPAGHPGGAPRTPIPPGVAREAGALDPSEEITPEELASIPEPVPAPESAREAKVEAVHPAAQESAPRSPGSGPESTPSGPSPAGSVWRVQIFASPDLSLADERAKEASARLGVPAHIEWEGSLYKVRLGDFPTEEGALALRERAVRSGYPGAFRIRCSPDTTRSNE